MKDWNTRVVLNFLRDRQTTAQAEICRQTGLSVGTVANTTRRLVQSGFIKISGLGRSSGGRKPVNLTFNEHAATVISAVVEAEETRVGLLDLAGNLVVQTAFATNPDQGPEAVLSCCHQAAVRLLAKRKIPARRIIAVCASFEAMVDAPAGILLYSAHLGWQSVPVKKILEAVFQTKAFVEPTGRAIALGEHRYGAGRGVNNLVCALIDSGLGAAVITNGRLHRGVHRMEGEIGHTPLNADGPLCRCGKRGCLEALASGSAIIRQAACSAGAKRSSSPPPDLSDRPEREAIRTILSGAESGQKCYREVISTAAGYLGLTLASAVNLLDPELVILTGYCIEEDPGIFLGFIRAEFEKSVLNGDWRKVPMVKGTLGRDAALIGGAILAYDDLFGFPE